MDPEATLQRATQAMREYDFDEAMAMIGAYCRWRRFGGYEPTDGDRQAQFIERTVRRWLKSRWRRQRNAR